MKKHQIKIIAASVAALLIIVGVVIGANIIFVKPTVTVEAESIILSQEQDKETSGFSGFTAALPWDSGSIEYKVNSCKVYESAEAVPDISTEDEAFIEENFYFTEVDRKMYGEPLFMVLDIEMKNIDANFDESYEGFLVNFVMPYPSEVFDGKSVDYEYFISDVKYMSLHKPFEELEKNSYKRYCEIDTEDFEKGETLKYQLGFYVDKASAERNSLILNIGTSDKFKYGIRLEVEKGD